MPVYTFTTLDDPVATNGTVASGINASGNIVGLFSGPSYGFLYAGVTYTTISFAQHLTEAGGINTAGQIVGSYSTRTTGWHGFFYSNGAYITLDDPAATFNTNGFGINDLGQIVGSYENASGTHGFLLSGGVYTTLD